MTCLANRTLFLARARQELERARHTRAGGGVLALDIDNFRDFNDTLGHAEADYGCDVVQGYLVSRPVPAAQLVTWLRAREVSGVSSQVSETAS